MDWKQTVFSDGSVNFVSNPTPSLGETIEVTIRVIQGAPVDRIILRRKKNGNERISDAKFKETRKGYDYYSVDVVMNEPVVHYHFYIISGNQIWYYNQYEMTEYIPTEVYDFKILADFKNPDWVSSSVMYQIFPDRFYNGNPSNDVQDGEYTFDGHPTVKMPWGTPVKEYDEVHCLDFYGGDLEGIEAKIPYLKEMGVNVVYVNPIFYAATSHKYDCLDYFHVDPHFGGDEALASLTDALHKEDMKLIVDVSINHTGTAHKWFNKEKTFFHESEGAYHNPGSLERHYYYFGQGNDYHAWEDVDTLPTLNYQSDELRDILYGGDDSVVQKWLKPPYNIDGWRFDVANTMAKVDDSQLSHEVWPAIRNVIKGINDKAYIIGEHWSDCNDNLQGDEWDTSMNYYGFGRPVRHFVGEQDLYLRRDADLDSRHYRLTAKNLSHRIMQFLGRVPYVVQNLQMNLLDSHDVPRLHNNPEIPFDKYRGAVILMFVMPGTPSIYYGDEVGIDGHLNSMEGCRYSFPWDEKDQKKAFTDLYSRLADLKRKEEVLHQGSFRILSNEGFVFACARFNEDEAVLAVTSMSDEDEVRRIEMDGVISLDGKVVTEVLGQGVTYRIEKNTFVVEVPARTSYLLVIK